MTGNICSRLLAESGIGFSPSTLPKKHKLKSLYFLIDRGGVGNSSETT